LEHLVLITQLQIILATLLLLAQKFGAAAVALVLKLVLAAVVARQQEL
jgi:hypothetical protein